MPGTGKTYLIVCLVCILVKLGKSVLLTSYTHTALDHILMKLMDRKMDFVRLGNSDKIDPSLLPYSIQSTFSFRSMTEMKVFYERKPIVATTCLSIKQ
jgi:DNA replication ATP-dependent helicase Dna2